MTAPPRAQFRRVKGHRKPVGSILCTRPGPLGNPFRVGDVDDPIDRFEAVEKFEAWARAVLDGTLPPVDDNAKFIEAFRAAKSATKLLCYCRLDQACHVDILRQLIQEGF